MKNIKLLSLVVLALGVVACDPYDDTKGGTPNVVGAGAANAIDGVDAVEGTVSGEAWTVAGVTCGGVLDADDVVVNPGAFDNSYFYVTLESADRRRARADVADRLHARGRSHHHPGPRARGLLVHVLHPFVGLAERGWVDPHLPGGDGWIGGMV